MSQKLQGEDHDGARENADSVYYTDNDAEMLHRKFFDCLQVHSPFLIHVHTYNLDFSDDFNQHVRRSKCFG